MKANVLKIIAMLGGLAISGYGVSQERSSVLKAERIQNKIRQDSVDMAYQNRISSWVKDSSFVVEPNRVSGYPVSPITNFILVEEGTLIFQTNVTTGQSSGYNLINKTVKGKVTSRKLDTNPRTGYHRLVFKIMTTSGIGFRIDMKISPTGSALVIISANNYPASLEYRGYLRSLDEANISIGAETFDLIDFPWFASQYIKTRVESAGR